MNNPSPAHIGLKPSQTETWVCLCGNTESNGGFEPCDATGEAMEPVKGWPELYFCNRCNRIIQHPSREIVGRRKLYSHAFTIAFSLESPDPTGQNVPALELRAAIKRRIEDISDEELPEAVGLPFDTGEVPQ